ncbi:integrin alpha-8 [Lingula anatina]|uniref:Integrin alpha-8 n=1 Tax=Lingula anatina TaxID=7574 RepID=A0A2R2MTG4_LINAN|nr:integrin alpha-8 [Lingula anatina]|eukprot:XP_023933312.1 integrin alpha-8 [Lingula anatina]
MEIHRKLVLLEFICCLLFTDFPLLGCFNVDLRTATIYTGEPDVMFGFSVAEHVDDANNVKWLLIGAPKSQTNQPGVKKGGAVYMCNPMDNRSCQTIPFDTQGADTSWNGTADVPSESKSGQWFGATVRSSQDGRHIVACAPRYVYFSRGLDKREPVGTCYVASNNATRFIEYSPCRTSVDFLTSTVDQYHKQGFCMQGWSASLGDDGERLLVGAVGAYYWQGQLFSINLNDRRDMPKTSEGSEEYDDSYLGYSSATGEFTGDNDPDFVAGVPRGNKLLGQVSVYDKTLFNRANISGEQLGAYFGASVAVDDFNNDGLDDIAVGAPFYTDYTAGSDNFEIGRVYIFYQDAEHRFLAAKNTTLSGMRSRSRFGSALAKLGNINVDDYNDLLVGAPYDGPDGRGAVYIYHGSNKGIRPQFSQAIFAKDLSPQLSSFGFAISGGHDMDGNYYPDVLIGSYTSGNAIFLRSRPIIHVLTTLAIDPQSVNLDRKLCHPDDAPEKSFTCITTETCLKYYGVGAPESIELSVKLVMDSDFPLNPRVRLSNSPQPSETFSMILRREEKTCKRTLGYMKDNIRNKLSPITITMEYKLMEPTVVPPGELLPILDQYIPSFVSTEARIQTNCGPDEICIPDLRIKAVGAPHTIGSNRKIEIDVAVVNSGEDAYESTLYVKLPFGISYTNTQGITGASPVSCEQRAVEEEGEYVVCDVGNPLQQKTQVDFKLRLSADDVTDVSSFLQFQLTVNSTNPENRTDLADNQIDVHVPVLVVANIGVTGVSVPEQLVYNSTYSEEIVTESEIGPQVIHKYQVYNNGPSSVNKTVVEITWPSYNMDGSPLLYLMETPKLLSGTGFCTAEDVNVRQIQLEPEDVVVEAVITEDQTLKIRRRREDDVQSPQPTTNTLMQQNCPTGHCSKLVCTLGLLNSGHVALIQIRARLWVESIVKGSVNTALIPSVVKATVQDVPYGAKPVTYSTAEFTVHTNINPETPDVGLRPIPIWIYIVAAIGGLLLLILLILILWKCGFFKRKRYQEMDEEYEETRKPLNATKNGAAVE